MVQDRISASAGKPLLHGFFTSQNSAHSDDMLMRMVLTSPDGTVREFVLGQGFAPGKGANGKAVAVFSLHHPEDLGAGKHEYVVTAGTEKDPDVYLHEEGILEVSVPKKAAESKGLAVWFDATRPRAREEDFDGVPPPEVPANVQEERLRTCGGCPAFYRETGECSECGCYMPFKTGLQSAECPLHKWSAWSPYVG